MEINTNKRTCPFGEQYQQYWDRLSDTERMMHLDVTTLSELTLQRTMREIAPRTPGRLILDLFCGAGGSAIGFARAGKRVIAADLKKSRLEMARYNAELYSVEDKIQFRIDDAIEMLGEIGEIGADTVFLDPPLSEDSAQKGQLSLSDFSPDGALLLELTLPRFRGVVMRVPNNFDLQQLNAFGRPFEIMENYFEKTLLHKTVFF